MNAVVRDLPFQSFWGQRNYVLSNPWTMTINEPVGAVLAYLANLIHLTPNQVTFCSLAVSIGGSVGYFFLPKAPISTLLLVFAFQLAYGLDCADGQLARATGRASAFGQWLDVAIDFAASIAVPAAMILHAVSQPGWPNPLWYVLAGVALSYSRVLVLFTYTTQRLQGAQGPREVSLLRKAFRLVTDTGFFLVIIVLARHWALVLLGVMFTYSLLHVVTAVYVARRMPRRS